MSEPDLIIEDEDQLVFVEVKYHSQNGIRSGYPKFSKYIIGNEGLFSLTPDAVARAGHYELTRNWIAGTALANQRGRSFVLVNLAGESCRQSAGAFAQMLSQPPERRFMFVAWPELLGRLTQPLEPWFGEYIRLRGLSE